MTVSQNHNCDSILFVIVLLGSALKKADKIRSKKFINSIGEGGVQGLGGETGGKETTGET